MPTYTVDGDSFEIMREAVLSDTNILVAAFDTNDSRHEDTLTYIDGLVAPLVVPVAVVIETWGFLVGSRKSIDSGLELLSWISNPGKAVILPQKADSSGDIQNYIRQQRIDCVDAMILQLADDISRQCDIPGGIVVASYDMRDFFRCVPNLRLKVRLRNPSIDEIYSFSYQ